MKSIIWVKIKDLNVVEKIDSGEITLDEVEIAVDFRLADLKNRKYNDYVQCIINTDTLRLLYENNKTIINKQERE